MSTTFVDFLHDAHDSPPMLMYETSILRVPEVWEYEYPREWLGALRHYKDVDVDVRVVPNETTPNLLHEKEPLVAIWPYRYGPRQYSQGGGDEDWTAVVRKSTYSENTLLLHAYLGVCGTERNDEDDFLIFTGTHA